MFIAASVVAGVLWPGIMTRSNRTSLNADDASKPFSTPYVVPLSRTVMFLLVIESLSRRPA
jgi:hypothetical protein